MAGTPLLLGVILATLLLIGVVVAVAIAAGRAKRRGDASPVVGVTLTLAAVYGVLCLVIAVVAVLSTLLSPTVTVTVPIRSYWPDFPGLEITGGPTATLVEGAITEADLTVEGLSTGARVLWAVGIGVGFLVPTAIATLVAIVCFQLLRGAAFAPLVAKASMATAIVVLVGGLASQVLCSIAGTMTAQETLMVSASEWTGYPDGFDPLDALPYPGFALTLEFWPIGAALGLAALAAVFRYGAKLQHDTELLV